MSLSLKSEEMHGKVEKKLYTETYKAFEAETHKNLSTVSLRDSE